MIQTGDGKLTVGLALGAGASYGWAHIGVLRTLIAAGIVPDAIMGCSAGALVGAYYSAGKLDRLEEWGRAQTVASTMGYLRLKRGYSLFGSSLFREMAEDFRGVNIEDLQVPFGAVATHLRSGERKLFTEGSLARAVAASGAFPLLFPPVKAGKAWYVDGCLTEPVPAESCRSFGVDIVIGVQVHKRTEHVYKEIREEARKWNDIMEDDFWESAEPPRHQNARTPDTPDTTAPAGRRGTPRLTAIAMQSLRALHRGRKGRRQSSNGADVSIIPQLGLLHLSPSATALTIERGAQAARQHLDTIYRTAQRIGDERDNTTQPAQHYTEIVLAHQNAY